MKNLLNTPQPSQSSASPKPSLLPSWKVLLAGLITLGGLVWATQQPWSPVKVELKGFQPQKLLSPDPQANSEPSKPDEQEEGDLSAYSAVTLDTDQVFYGKLTSGDPYMTLTDAFYFQPGLRSAQAGSIRIIKVGTELHDPQDLVYLNRSHIVTTQQLTSDSKIVRAIEEYNKSQ